MRNRRSTVLVGVLAAGVLLSQQACTPIDRQSGGPVAFTTPPAESPAAAEGADPAGSPASPSTKAAAPKPAGNGKKPAPSKIKDPILAGRRQVVIKPVPSYESIVVVDDRGRLGLTDGDAEHNLFVLAPSGDKFQIKTAKAGTGGEPSCLGIKSGGTSLTVEAAACDAGRAGQLFTLTRQKAKENGDPTYAISNQGAFLQESRSGLIAEELGDSPLRTTFAFVDNGPATLPALD